MTHTIEIIPSLLVSTEQEFIQKYRGLDGSVNCIQLDIADGIFVPNTTWRDPAVIQKEVTDTDVELHLMVNNPLEELEEWRGVPQIKRILVHYECDNFESIFEKLPSYGWQVGIAINPDTPISVLEPYIPHIQAVLIMSVIPGKQGQPFIPAVLEKISALRNQHPNLFIEIDGAVNTTTLPAIIASGVNAICPGSAIVGSGNPKENVKNMQQLIHTLTNPT